MFRNIGTNIVENWKVVLFVVIVLCVIGYFVTGQKITEKFSQFEDRCQETNEQLAAVNTELNKSCPLDTSKLSSDQRIKCRELESRKLVLLRQMDSWCKI